MNSDNNFPIISAGVIVVSVIDDTPQILLVEHKEQTYSFPKGHIEDGETEEEAAKREVLEETGVVLPEKIVHLGYIERLKKEKRLAMFGSFIPYPTKYEEHEEVFAWFTFDDALKVLRFPEDAEFLKENFHRVLEYRK